MLQPRPRTFTFPTRIAFDCTLKRPACVLLQIAFGCPEDLAYYFDSLDWLVAPTPNMHVYPLANEEQLEHIIKIVGDNSDRSGGIDRPEQQPDLLAPT